MKFGLNRPTGFVAENVYERMMDDGRLSLAILQAHLVSLRLRRAKTFAGDAREDYSIFSDKISATSPKCFTVN